MANRNDDWANDPRFDRRPDWGIDLDRPRWESRDFMTNQPYRERAEVEGFRNYPPEHYWDRPRGSGRGEGYGGREWQPDVRDERHWASGFERGGRGPEPYQNVSRNYGPGGENWTERNQSRGGDIGGYDRGASAFSGYGRETGGFGRSGQFGTIGGYRGPEEFRGNNFQYTNTGGMGRVGQFTGRGPRGYQRSDDRIREEVCEILTRHGEIDASEIDIDVNNGEVTLTGTVDDRYQKRLAEDIVEQVSGVRDVQNQIRVQQRADIGEMPTSGRSRSLGTTERTSGGGTATGGTSGAGRGRGGEERIAPTGTTSREGRRRVA